MEINKDILIKIKQAVYHSDPNAEIILYGSRASGVAKTFSDWDLLVLLNTLNLSFDQETTLMDDLYDVEIDTGEVISPMIYTKKDWKENHFITPLFENIEKEGIRL